MIFPLLVIGLVLYVAYRAVRGRDGGPDVSWGSSSSTASTTAAPRPEATDRQVASALGRVEARQTLRSIPFGIGLVFCLMVIWVFCIAYSGDADSWPDWFTLMPVISHPLVGMAVVATHAAVTRGRRDGAEELFTACPVSLTTRTAGHLRAAWVPAATLTVFLVVTTALVALRGDRVNGPIAGDEIATALAAIALGACGAALGVALGRWAAWRLVPVAVVAALFMPILGVGTLGQPRWSQMRQLSTFPVLPDHNIMFVDARRWTHLAWLLLLGALMAVIAVLRTRRDRVMLITAGAVAVITLAAGIATSRPISSASAARLASLITEPANHQTCRTDGKAQVCAYDGREEYIDLILPEVAPVLAATPAAVGTITMRQAFDGTRESLDPKVARLVKADLHDPFEPALGFATQDDALLGARFKAALWAVRLPSQTAEDEMPVVIAGEARGVVALWLAARGLAPEEAVDLASNHWDAEGDDDGRMSPIEAGAAWPEPCYNRAAPVAWGATDLAAAAALLELPERNVATLIASDWQHLTDPDTTTDELLVATGLDPLGPPEQFEAEPITCSY